MKRASIILAIFLSISSYGMDYQIDTITINSKILKEKRAALVFKPSTLKQTDSVSLLYMLDGESSRNRYELILQEQFSKSLIVVGIINSARRRDMLQKKEPDKFLDFIINELIPKIEADLIIDQRILFGHSYTGGFTIYTLIKQTNTFDKYIASSSTPLTNMVNPRVYQQIDNKINHQVKLYFSYGSKDLKQVREWNSALLKNLDGLKLNHLKWKNEVYKEENHITSVKISLIKGLRY
jgi:predicted alpha/beta superfamily hydrolase